MHLEEEEFKFLRDIILGSIFSPQIFTFQARMKCAKLQVLLELLKHSYIFIKLYAGKNIQ